MVSMAVSLRARHYNAYLVCRPQGIMADRARETGLPAYSAPYSNSLDIFTVARILKIIRKLRIELIVCSTNLDIKLAGLAGKIAGIPVISRQGLALIPNTLKYKFLVRHFTDSILTNTVSIKRQYEAYGWFPPDFIQVIYNGTAIPDPRTVPETVKDGLRESPAHKLVLSAGRLNSQKGFGYLIDAARIAQENEDLWNFVILGNGTEKAALLHQIKKHRLKNVKLLGFQKDMQVYYSSADIFVLSSIAEGTPNVVLEAMSHKCPVIATGVNGVSEIIENGKNGWIIPVKNSQAIYEALRSCFANPEQCSQMAENAYHIVRKKYTIANSTDQFIQYINRIIAKYEKNHHKDTQLSR